MSELEEKYDRLARFCAAAGLDGVLLTTQPNFAWATGGRTNRIDGATQAGNGALLFAADGRRFVVADRIEMPRLVDEAVHGQGYTPVEYPWTDGIADGDHVVRRARQALGGAAALGVDLSASQEGRPVDAELTRLRARLTSPEIERYRRLGAEVGREVGDLCRRVQRGASELEVARLANDAVAAAGARATVTLVAADDRIARYRHPVPTGARWDRQLLIVVCAERHGLVVALSRIVCAGAVPEVLARRTQATARVFGRMLGASVPGTAARGIFAEAARAYADEGFAGEEMRHHQGGAIGYRSRDWIAHPASDERIDTRQALAWNPSITGTKVEETALLVDGRLELVTTTPGWPSESVRVGEQEIPVPLVLECA